MDQHHVFIDLVVSHPNPSTGEILGVAAIRTDRKGKVVAAFSEKVKPKTIDDNSQLPADYDEAEWKDAQGLKQVWKRLTACILSGQYEAAYVVVGHNAEVKRRFLREGLGSEPFTKKAWIDTLQLAWPLAYTGMLGDRSFDTLCKHFQVMNVAPDTATGDCTALVEVYWLMMSRYRTALFGEEAVRDFGGESLAKLRQWVGI